MSALQRLPFVGALIVLAGVVAGGVYVYVRTHFVLWLLLTFIVALVFGGVYLWEYSKLPGPPGWTESRPIRPSFAPSDPEAATPSADSGTGASGSTKEPAIPIDPADLAPDYDPVEEADAIESSKPAGPPNEDRGEG